MLRSYTCKKCGRTAITLSARGYCPPCESMELFASVRDYIRSSDVKERDVAEHFGIPMEQVKDWIRAGRIEYKKGIQSVTSHRFCELCGRPIEIGSVCLPCRRKAEEGNRKEWKGISAGKQEESDKMRYLGK